MSYGGPQWFRGRISKRASLRVLWAGCGQPEVTLVGEKKKNAWAAGNLKGGRYGIVVTRGLILDCVVFLFEFASVLSIPADFFICIYTLADAVMKRGELTVCWGRRTADIWQQLSVVIWPLMTISICGKVGHGCLKSLFSLHDKPLYSVIRAELCLLTTFSSNAPESIHSSVSW